MLREYSFVASWRYPSETATRIIILILAKRLVQQLTVLLEQQHIGYL